jgi:hypothetical protein
MWAKIHLKLGKIHLTKIKIYGLIKIMDFNKFKEEMTKAFGNPIYLVSLFAMAILLIIALLLPIAGEWILYWIYYKPLYTLFKNSIYLPIYLDHLGSSLALVFFTIMIFTQFKKIIAKIIGLLVIVGIVFLLSKGIYKDIGFINAEKYRIIECNIETLVRSDRGQGGRFYYRIKGNVKNNGKMLSIEMDFYQYIELLKIKDEGINIMVTINYVPDAVSPTLGRMLNNNLE